MDISLICTALDMVNPIWTDLVKHRPVKRLDTQPIHSIYIENRLQKLRNAPLCGLAKRDPVPTRWSYLPPLSHHNFGEELLDNEDILSAGGRFFFTDASQAARLL